MLKRNASVEEDGWLARLDESRYSAFRIRHSFRIPHSALRISASASADALDPHVAVEREFLDDYAQDRCRRDREHGADDAP
jgi:hypothetical protein